MNGERDVNRRYNVNMGNPAPGFLARAERALDDMGPFGEGRYVDELGHHLGYCNHCGEEAELGQECCEEGEVVQYEDDEVEF